MKLTKNFREREFVASETAEKKGLRNEMNIEQLICATNLLATILQPLRDYLGKPIKITSGFRGVALNRAVKGSETSEHCTGEAVDFQCEDMKKAFNWIKNNCEFNQLIWEFGDNKAPQWIHVSYKRTGNNKKTVLRAVKKNGKTEYIQLR